MDTISSVPRINSADFEKLFNNHLQVSFRGPLALSFLANVLYDYLQDLLMVIYLSNLTRTQLAIAQRLHNLV
jgi:translation initiation factor 3 subunit F